MKVNASQNTSTTVYSTTTNKSIHFEEVLMNTQILTKENEQASNEVYKKLSTQYNVRNATFEEIVDIAHALYEADEMTGKEVTILTFDYERATNYMKQHAPTPVSADFSMYETVANANGKRDWIEELQARAAKALQYGDLIGYQARQKIANTLKQIDEYAHSTISTFDDLQNSKLTIEEANAMVDEETAIRSGLLPEDAPKELHDYVHSLSLREKMHLFIMLAVQDIKANAYKDHNGHWKVYSPGDSNYVDIFKLPDFSYTKLADLMLDDLEFQRKYMEIDEYELGLSVLTHFKLIAESNE
ncbi:hypothetical protein AAGS61_09285 [Lysinibacillus sp. KU-BSD001]|uniref:hypothetical protein n=1 Tax=Lysinibacillus sp. KU-BSD001 TaxID=3141328 RepID=UPI0036DFBAEA